MNSHEEKFQRCVALFNDGRFADAIKIASELNSEFPSHTGVLLLLLKSYYFLNDFENSERKLLELIEVEKNNSGYHSMLALVQKKLGKIDTAVVSYQNAISLDPGLAENYYNLGILFFETGEYQKSLENFNKAVMSDEYFYLAHYNAGNVYRKLKNYVLSAESYRKAITVKPDFEDAHYNLGVVLEYSQNFNEALISYENTLKLNPGNIEAKWNRSLLLLLKGNYETGLKEYECRIEKNQLIRKNRAEKRWNGESLTNKKLLVYSEQGFGDTMQFLRFIPRLKEKGAFVILETRPELIDLLKNKKLPDKIISRDEHTDFICDYEVPLLSLPFMLRLKQSEMGMHSPYIEPDLSRHKNLVEKIKSLNGFKTGIVWRGNPAHIRDDERSVDISLFESLSEIKDLKLISLQKGISEPQIIKDLLGKNITRFGNNFDEISAVISQLDLVISVDTAVAHLAGAMNKPVWTLIPAYPDWRWGLNGSETFWYPSMKLYRREAGKTWEDLFKNLSRDLEYLITKSEKIGKQQTLRISN